MKFLNITFLHMRSEYTFLDDASALESYHAVKDALGKYREFGNDRDGTISFSDDSGSCTVRLAAVCAVDVTDALAARTTIIQREVWKASMLKQIDAAKKAEGIDETEEQGFGGNPSKGPISEPEGRA